jgi:large subunit ribosomal protein L25
MDTIKLSVHEREETGDGPARRLRAQGRVPGVAYGKGKVATPISIDLDELKAAMAHGHNVILELDFGKGSKAGKGKKGARYAVVKQMQLHPTKRHVLHVDLHEVDLAEEIEALVALEAVGTAPGLRDGGILEWERREVTVRALPADMPEVLELDVSKLLVGHHLTVGALTAPKGVTILDEPDTVVLALVPPRVEHVAAEVVEGEAEPEVIGGHAKEE